jgi:assimilatory nitrate reductase catalytic subunit
VVQEAFLNTDTVPYADVLLPATSWSEKEGTVTNSERRISRVRAALPAPGEAKADWWIAKEIARRIEARLAPPGATPLFEFADTEAVFDEHRRLTVGRDLDIGGLDYTMLETRGPQQWPFPAGATEGQARRYGDGVFATGDGRARFHITPYKPVAEPISARYPLRLLTGRLRDQWHGMSRSGRVPGLFAHAPEPELTMHPDDATRRGLRAGDLVRVTSKRGELLLPLVVSDEVGSGTVFAAMHWSGQFLSSGGVNEVSNGAVDPKSFQPELKHAAVRVEKAAFAWNLLAARRGDALALQIAVQPLLHECAFASLTLRADADPTSEQAWLVVRAAADSAPPQWVQRLAEALRLQPDEHVLEYHDARRGLLKRVGWGSDAHNDRIEGLLLSGGQRDSASEALLDIALSGTAWTGSRLAVFTQRLPGGARDALICQCMQVRESPIRAAIAQGADVGELKKRLGCGSVCGYCVPQLVRMCREIVDSG